MSLHTSEAPISVYIGTRGLQSLPVPSPLSPSDRAETPEFSSLDIDDEKATKAEGDLCHEHKRLLARWGEERSGIWNAAAMQQTETAVISLFATFMGILFTQVVAPNIPDIPATAITAMHFFSFSGLALILIGAVLTLISARDLRKTANEFNIIRKKFRLSDVTRLPGSRDVKCCNIPDDLDRILRIMDRSLDAGLGEFIVTMTGVAFFLLSFCILLIATQGVVVWAMVVVFMIWSGVQLFYDSRIWGKLPIITDMARGILRY